jgi:hypothetical protein
MHEIGTSFIETRHRQEASNVKKEVILTENVAQKRNSEAEPVECRGVASECVCVL